VTLVEYGDFECPDCGRAFPIVKQLQRVLGDRLRFVFRSFPLIEIHPYAEIAAEAAECAAAQGQFWPMFDTLFEHQEALAPQDLVRYAATLGLDVPRFERDLADHRYAARVREEKIRGIENGVQGTPTFFINGRMHQGSYDYGTLLRALEREIGAGAR
jgi:protein-disulfide isomerase